MALDNRVTIFTKDTSSKYGSRALVLDLSRDINHNYNTSVAKHPIEGASSGRSDHSFLENIKVSISGHISDAMPISQEAIQESFYPRGIQTRQDTSQEDATIEEISNKNDQLTQIDSIVDTVPITQEQADALNANSVGGTYTAGQTVTDIEKQGIQYSTESDIDSLVIKRDEIQATRTAKEEALQDIANNIVYPTDADSKHLDAFELLEGIYHGRLLVDVLTSNRLYEDMVMRTLSLPRSSGAGQALELRASFEQQRFVSIQESDVVTNQTSASERNVPPQKDNGKDQGTTRDPSDPRNKQLLDKLDEIRRYAER